MENLAFFGGRRIVDSTGAQLAHNPWAYTDLEDSTGAQPHNPWAYTDLEDALKRYTRRSLRSSGQ